MKDKKKNNLLPRKKMEGTHIKSNITIMKKKKFFNSKNQLFNEGIPYFFLRS